MSNNTSLVTEAARSAASQNTADYTDSVAAHIAGDYGKHNQVAVYPGPYPVIPVAHASHVINGVTEVRMLITIGSVDYAVIVPAIPTGVVVNTGTNSGSAGAFAPVFTQQPLSGAFTVNSTVSLITAVDGTKPVLFQWQRNGVNLPKKSTTFLGAHDSTLLIVGFSATTVGDYRCIATNANGQAISHVATLTVRASSGNAVPGGTTPSNSGGL